MKPWMNRTESSAIAAMRQCRSPNVAAAAGRGAVSNVSTVMLSARICVIEAGPLQLGQGTAYPGCQHHAGNQVIGQLGSQRVVRQFILVRLNGDQLLRQLPYRIVTGEEDRAALLQRRDRVVVSREGAFGVLVV